MKPTDFLLIFVSFALIIATLKMNSLYKEKEVYKNSYNQLVRRVEMVLDAYDGERPHIEIQLLFFEGKDI